MTKNPTSGSRQPTIIPRAEHNVTRAEFSKSALKVLYRLNKAGYQAFLVGGCVRDAILGVPVKDIDIATHEPPETVMALLEAAGIKAIPTGIDHGTVTAVVEAAHFEITTLRLDVKTHGRRAEVVFTDDWAEDAARRDLTINALSLSQDGTVHDPFGGLDDLAAGRVRFVGDAETRITEDVLRLLRFFRFQAYYGRGPADGEALAAVEKLAPRIPTLSGERIWGEMMRLLMAPDPAAIFRLMADHGVISHLLPGAVWIERLGALAGLEAAQGAQGIAADPLRRLAALVRMDGAIADELAVLLRLSRRQRQRLAAIAGAALALPPEADAVSARADIYRLGTALFRDVVLLAWAAARAEAQGAPPDESFAALVALAATWPRPELPVRGEDAVKLGLSPGPAVGAAVGAVEAWWIAEDFKPGREACLAQLKTVIGRV